MSSTSWTPNKVTSTMNTINSAFDGAKKKFTNLITDRRWAGALYLYLLIIIIIWLLAYYIMGKLELKTTNNNNMLESYKLKGGSKISNIGKSDHQFKLRDYFVASSYNSCCGGNVLKDFVDMVPLNEVIQQGARWLDFEIYSIDGSPIVAAGPDPTPDGKYCLKGTYNSLSFKKVMGQVNMLAFSGLNAPNPDDPLFLSFRIKTNNKNIYSIMANVLNKTFSGKFLGPKYGHDGKYNKSGNDVIPNIPLMNLKQKVIIFVDDPNSNYRDTSFEEYVNMSGHNYVGDSMPFVTTYRNIDVIQAYDPKALRNQNKKFLGISMPDFTKIVSNSPATIHHSFGIQFVLMNYALLDHNMEYYLNFFNNNGSAFVLKPDHLRYWETVIKKPKQQLPQLSYKTRHMNTLQGAYKPGI